MYIWEPGAPPPGDRIKTVLEASAYGIRTWISLEPVIDPAEAYGVIMDLRTNVDHWKIGKLNHMPEIGRTVNWAMFVYEAKGALGQVGADYYIKRDLLEAATVALER